MYLSLPIVDGDSVVPFFCQVLRMEPKVTSVRLHDDRPIGLLDIFVQPLHFWSPATHGPAELCDRAEVFVLEEPCTLDILKRVEPTLGCRARMFRWYTEKSDLLGCISMVRPEQLRPPATWSLAHERMPTVCLLDALQHGGFQAVTKIVNHTADPMTKQYDSKHPTGKRNYFRCVLASEELFNAGVESFKSNRSSAWYAHMLKFTKAPDDKHTAAEAAEAHRRCCR